MRRVGERDGAGERAWVVVVVDAECSISIDQDVKVPVSPCVLSIILISQSPDMDSPSKSDGVKVWEMSAPEPVWSRSVISVPSGDVSFMVSWDSSGWVISTSIETDDTVPDCESDMVPVVSPGAVVVVPSVASV